MTTKTPTPKPSHRPENEGTAEKSVAYDETEARADAGRMLGSVRGVVMDEARVRAEMALRVTIAEREVLKAGIQPEKENFWAHDDGDT